MKRHAVWAVPAAAVLFLLLCCYFLYDSLFPIFLGFGLAYAFGPLVDWLERKGVSRAAAAGLLLAATASAAILAVALLIPALLSEARDLATHFPA